MNPYLEQEDVWHGFHQHFIPRVAEVLVPQVRPRYIVLMEQHAYIHEMSADDRRPLGRPLGRPDVAVATAGAAPPAGGQAAPAAAAVHAPAYVEVPITAVDVERESYLTIRDRRTRQLVTVIELLSPANKRPGVERQQYLLKRTGYLASDVHLVEIDLLRGWPRLPLRDLPPCDYYALVSRAGERPRAGIWPIGLRDRLPEIPVPLRPPDADARLDLQAVLHHLYDAGGYADYIYAGAPHPALGPADEQWARQFVPAPPV